MDDNASFEREKWSEEVRLKERELAIKEREVAAKEREVRRFLNPVTASILAAGAAFGGNALVTYWNNNAQQNLERIKAEAQFIVEMIKTNQNQAAENLDFLIQTGLISDDARRASLSTYLEKRKEGQGPALPVILDIGRPVPPTHQVDYLFRFTSLEAAKTTLPQLWAGNDWRRDIVFNVDWYEDNAPNPARGAPKEDGYYMLVSKTGIDEALWAIPECVIELDRDAKLVHRSRLKESELRKGHFEPVPAGSDYPIPLYKAN
jgi:hypothetical protein